MIHSIGTYTFELLESVKVRQAQSLMKLGQSLEKGEIDDIDMAVRTLSVMLISINGDTDKSKFYDFLMDNLETEEMMDLSEKVMEVVNSFVKKNQNSSSSTKHSSIDEVVTSPASGEQ